MLQNHTKIFEQILPEHLVAAILTFPLAAGLHTLCKITGCRPGSAPKFCV